MSERDDQMRKQLLTRRIVFLDDDIDKRTADRLRGDLLELSFASRDPIKMVIDSCGGNVPHGLFICDFMACLRVPIIGVVMGECSSMAIPVLQSCKERLSLRHSIFFLHFLSLEIKLNQRFSKEQLQKLFDQRFEEGRAEQVEIVRLLSKRTGHTARKIREMMEDGDARNLRLNAEQALAMNFLDGIIEDPKDFFGEEIKFKDTQP
jgi:ATP-dependent protease ClpP protease subunit